MPAVTDPKSTIVHGSAVALGGRAVLILGTSGSGKSSLSLQLIARGGQLVADDRVILCRRGETLVASAPPAIAGLIEARGLGLLRLEAIPEAPVVLAVDLDQRPAARLPHPVTITHLGVPIKLISGKDLPNLDFVLSIVVQDSRALLE
jgi:HPr kinase/phosphorylase